MLKLLTFTVASIAGFFSPIGVSLVNAATTPQTVNQIFKGFADDTYALAVPVLVAIGVVTFLAGVIRFVGAGDNEEMRQSGQKVMVYGVIVLFVMVAYWGFVKILSRSFFGENPKLPNYLPPLKEYND